MLPQNEVTEVLFDPDFASSFDVVRYTNARGPTGRGVSTVAIQKQNVSGVIYPDKGRNLQRLGLGQKNVDSIRVVTTYRLSPGSQGLDADIVAWNGAHYTVVAIADWSQYGAGFVEATCDMLEFVHP